MQYRVIRSGRRTLALEITPSGEILVRAPHAARDSEIAAFAKEHRTWVDSHLPKVLSRQRPPLTPEEEKSLRRLAKADLPERTARWAARMGVDYAGVSITSARHRFGSCNSRGKICFSFRLLEFPEEVIDYVVVHELAHRREMNHSPRFYAIVAQYLPDYRRRRALLRSLPHSQ